MYAKKVIRCANALSRFSIRPQRAEESEKDYNAYLGRKDVELTRLKKSR